MRTRVSNLISACRYKPQIGLGLVQFTLVVAHKQRTLSTTYIHREIGLMLESTLAVPLLSKVTKG